jgi:hypothetical protein
MKTEIRQAIVTQSTWTIACGLETIGKEYYLLSWMIGVLPLQVVGESISGKNRGTSVPIHFILQKLTITLLNQNNKRHKR